MIDELMSSWANRFGAEKGCASAYLQTVAYCRQGHGTPNIASTGRVNIPAQAILFSFRSLLIALFKSTMVDSC